MARLALAAASRGAADGVGAHGAVVVLDHDLVDPATLGGGGDDFGESAVVAAQPAELDLPRFLELLERGLDVGIGEQRDFAAVDAVEVVAVDIVSPEPFETCVQLFQVGR